MLPPTRPKLVMMRFKLILLQFNTIWLRQPLCVSLHTAQLQ